MADDREALKLKFGSYANAFEFATPEQPERKLRPVRDTLSEYEPVMRQGFDQFKLKLRRSQRRNLWGGVGFSVHFIAELSPEAKEAVRYYGFGKAILYQKDLRLKLTANIPLMIWRFIYLWLTRHKWRITVNDLVKGRTMTCKDILEMMEAEENIKETTEFFTKILRSASYFGGEEVIDM